jgi:hypothetical protein
MAGAERIRRRLAHRLSGRKRAGRRNSKGKGPEAGVCQQFQECEGLAERASSSAPGNIHRSAWNQGCRRKHAASCITDLSSCSLFLRAEKSQETGDPT